MKLLRLWTLLPGEKLYWGGTGELDAVCMPVPVGGALKGFAGQAEGREALAVSEAQVRKAG